MTPTIIFDIGNVLLAFDYDRAVRRFGATTPGRTEELLDAVLGLRDDYECGRMTTDEFTDRLREATGHPGTDEEIRMAYADIFEPIPAMWDLVESLSGRYPLHLLSNTSDLHLSFVRGRYPVFRHFSSGTYSFEVGVMKPDAAIYRAAIEATGRAPGELVFIDDMEHNVAAARQAGIATHHYHADRHGDLLEFLERKGVTP